MPILVQTVRIAGFRGLSNLELELGKRVVLIGPNNTGKTSAMKALQLALGDSRFIAEEDFHVDVLGKVAEQILVDVRMVPTDDNGEVVKQFDRKWQAEFRNSISVDPGSSGQNSLMFRVRIARTDDQKRYYPERNLIKQWPQLDVWVGGGHVGQEKFPGAKLAELLPFYFQDAQRDIMEDARQRHSYLGRVLSKVVYQKGEVEALQGLIDQLNQEAVQKSSVLGTLQEQLSRLGSAVGSIGKAEISPIAKELRDLTKGLRLNYEEAGNSFGMEYHGMGTRSWASLLVLKAFAKIVESERTSKPFHPLLALEEPEAHLHPNAQRQVYQQMVDFPGQVIVSTHSPYVASQSRPQDLRSLVRSGQSVKACAIPKLSAEDERSVRRRVIDTRGEILFARLVVLFEGETEEQALPLLYEANCGCGPCDVGVCFVGVGGAGGYEPFLRTLESLRASWLIFSDGEPGPIGKVKAAMRNAGVPENDERFVTIPDGMCFESYLIQQRYDQALVRAIEAVEGAGAVDRWVRGHHGKEYKPRKTNDVCPQCNQAKYKSELRDYSGDEGQAQALLEQLMSGKTKYASAIAREISALDPDRRCPPIIRTLFNKIQARLGA